MKIRKKRTIVDAVAMPLHILLGLAVLVLAVSIFLSVRKSNNKPLISTALYGLISIIIAFCGGVAVVLQKEFAAEVASFIMSLGYIAAFLVYVYLYFIHRGESVITRASGRA